MNIYICLVINVLIGVVGIVLLVLVIMIIVVLYVSVFEWICEIGVLCVFGVCKCDISYLFFVEVLIIGVLVVVMGLLFGEGW